MKSNATSLHTATQASKSAEEFGQNVLESRAVFSSGGRDIRVDGFHLDASGRHPAIMVLHGAGGVMAGNAFVHQLASAFACAGYGTFLVHYFDRTGIAWASDDAIRANFEVWLSTLSDAVSFVTAHPEIDAARLATLGFSLGGYLALAHAARDPRVRAVVEIAGGIDPSYANRVDRMPPTMIVHGEEDRRVPVHNAHAVAALLRKLNTTCELDLYPREGHILSPAAALSAFTRGIAFLQKHLPRVEGR